MSKPYELLARFNKDGTIAGCHVKTIETVDGKDYESDAVPLKDATDPAFTAFAELFSTSVASDNTILKAKVAELEAKVSELEQFRPFNPRIIDAASFFERITKDEFAKLSTSDDDTLRSIAKTIIAYKDNDWPVVFESVEMQGMLAYLKGIGFLSSDREAELTKDATQAEAYIAD